MLLDQVRLADPGVDGIAAAAAVLVLQHILDIEVVKVGAHKNVVVVGAG